MGTSNNNVWDEEHDLVVVGSGAAGFVAALVAADANLKAVIFEKEAKWGGTSAYSGGGLWIPNNDLMKRDQAGDSEERALQYMNSVIKYDGPASSPDRRQAYVQSAREMAAYLEGKGFKWVRAERYPDYYPEAPGGMIGRGLEGEVFDGRRLGTWLDSIAGAPGQPSIALTTRNVEAMPQALRTVRGFFGTASIIARTVWWKGTGRKPLGIGQALVGRLMEMALKQDIPVRLSTPMRELIVEDGAVQGIVVEQAGKRLRVRARYGVVLTAGGFAKNANFRRQHQPVEDRWSSVSPGDQGDAIISASQIGAATALMDDAWWGASVLKPDGSPAFSVHERSLPSSIIVGLDGKRFVNESSSYVDVGHAILDQNPGGEPPPVWLIMDSKHRNRYMFGMALPGRTPQRWIESGNMKRADTVEDLASQCGIDVAGLKATIQRFNGFAKSGTDLDFRRGESAYDRYYSDPTVKPNPNLGTIEDGPFYAVRVVPGDLGTKGGLVTDKDGRVLREDLIPIPGLYASGNTTASVMGNTYPGPGSTLGPSTTFAFRAAKHAAALGRQTQH